MKNNLLNLPQNNTTIFIDTSYDYNYLLRPETDVKNVVNYVFSKSKVKSQITFKIIIDKNINIDLETIVNIPKDIIEINTYLKFRILKLSSDSKVRIVPSLKIHENNVKAGHGVSISNIDKGHLFYLQSRGIAKKISEKIIVDGFKNS